MHHRKLAEKGHKEGKHRQANKDAAKAAELHLEAGLKEQAANDLVSFTASIYARVSYLYHLHN